MAALGAVTTRTPPDIIPVRVPISAYQVIRGNYLGVLAVRVDPIRINRRADLSDYVVRQISIIYRQLWPQHGQRFPQ